jgi:hypothetical protein
VIPLDLQFKAGHEANIGFSLHAYYRRPAARANRGPRHSLQEIQPRAIHRIVIPRCQCDRA